MKELSIEDKAKRYDEALKVAKGLYAKDAPDSLHLERMFPELKESEDERIRKALVEMVHDTTGDSLWVDYNIHKEDAIAWLEKQGEQKPNYCHHEVDLSDCSEEYRKAYYDGWNNCNQQHAQLKTEQKPAWSEEDETMVNSILSFCDFKVNIELHNEEVKEASKKVLSWLNELKDRVQPKSINDWSEEDERIRFETIELLETANHPNKMHSNGKPLDFTENINWLKSLKGRVQPQPKQEWSEEDEQTFIKAVEALEDFGKFELADWLKEHKNQSLRSQSHWKPTERMLEALKWAKCEFHPDCPETMEQLKYLYQELKQLYYDRT